MTAKELPTVLQEIVAQRRTHLPAIRDRLSYVDLASVPPSERSLVEALDGANRFIMECKSASPSLGLIRADYRPGDIARIYSRYASAISVLCEPARFGGDYDHLQTVAQTTHLPVLCKDFIVDPIQVYAARHYGADAILLMMSIVDDDTYVKLKALADELGLDVLTEAITEEEVERALQLGGDIIGINNRNLHDLSIDLERTERLASHIPEGKTIVSESGIRDNATVRRLGSHVHAFLVGSQLSRQEDIDRAARDLVYGGNKVCGLNSASAAQAARAAGARYGGLIFVRESPRTVSRETARDIISAEPGLDYVAVTRSSDIEELQRLSELPGLKALQLHTPFQGSGEAEREFLRQVRSVAGGLSVWRAVDMLSPDFAGLATDLVPEVEALVLDSGSGGSGSSFEWSTIPPEVKDKSFLAGGLRLDNLEEALSIGTMGLDLNSGLEYAPGRKDSSLVSQAFHIIRRYTHP